MTVPARRACVTLPPTNPWSSGGGTAESWPHPNSIRRNEHARGSLHARHRPGVCPRLRVAARRPGAIARDGADRRRQGPARRHDGDLAALPAVPQSRVAARHGRGEEGRPRGLGRVRGGQAQRLHRRRAGLRAGAAHQLPQRRWHRHVGDPDLGRWRHGDVRARHGAEPRRLGGQRVGGSRTGPSAPSGPRARRAARRSASPSCRAAATSSRPTAARSSSCRTARSSARRSRR